MNLDREQIEAFDREVVKPVQAECARVGAPHLGKPLVKAAAVATEFGKFAVHNNFWRMPGEGDIGSNLELVLSPCPERVYKPLKRRVARFSTPAAAAREAVRRTLHGETVKPEDISMIQNSNNVRFAAWGGLSDILDVAIEKVGNVASVYIDSQVASGDLTQEDAMALKAGGTITKELSTGGVEIYEYIKGEGGEDKLVVKTASGATKEPKGSKEDEAVFLGLTQTQLLLGGAGLLGLVLFLRHRDKQSPRLPTGGFDF